MFTEDRPFPGDVHDPARLVPHWHSPGSRPAAAALTDVCAAFPQMSDRESMTVFVFLMPDLFPLIFKNKIVRGQLHFF